MKVGDKVWIPVEVIKRDDNDKTTKVKYLRNTGEGFWVADENIQTVTAEDYHNALNEFYDMNTKEREEIWGLSLLSDALKVTVEEFVSKLRKYQEEPKTGQIWKYSTGEKVVIFRADKSEVHYCRPCGNTSWVSRNYFGENFLNTGEVLTSVATFLKDLEGLNEKG